MLSKLTDSSPLCYGIEALPFGGRLYLKSSLDHLSVDPPWFMLALSCPFKLSRAFSTIFPC